jgi:hypothetical protein
MLLQMNVIKCPWDESTCAHAAGEGHLDVVKWLRENKCPWDEWTCADAAQEGHLAEWMSLGNGDMCECCSWWTFRSSSVGASKWMLLG